LKIKTKQLRSFQKALESEAIPLTKYIYKQYGLSNGFKIALMLELFGSLLVSYLSDKVYPFMYSSLVPLMVAFVLFVVVLNNILKIDSNLK
jgi:hypothetical protein